MTDWNSIAADVGTVVETLAPLVSTLDPAAAPAIELGAKIVKGALAELPAAKALYDQIVSGTPPTPEQLASFEADYESSYSKLEADISAKEKENG